MKKFGKTALFIVVVSLFAIVSFYLYDTLRDRTYAEKIAEIVHLEDRRLLNSNLRTHLGDSSNKVRAKAAMAIGRIDSPESAKLLLEILQQDASIDVATTAAFAIGLTSDKKYASELLEIAFDLPARVGAACVEAAGRLADSSMTDVSDQLLSYFSHPAPEVREAAMMAILNSGSKSKTDQLITHLNSSFETDKDVKVRGMYVLARMGVAEASDIYISHLANSDPFVRASAIRGLQSVKTKEAVNYLGIALNDSDRKVVAQAILSLSKSKSTKAKNSLVDKLATADDENLIIALFSALSAQENSTGIDIAYTFINENESPNVVGAAVNYITAINGDKAVILIDSILAVSSGSIKTSCADAYGKIKSDKIIPRLSRLFNDEDPLIRYHALGALFEIDSSNHDYYIKTALNDNDDVVIIYALNLIIEKLYRDYLPVMKTMITMEEKMSVDVRRTIIEGTETFLKENIDDTLAQEILVNGALDQEYIIRKIASRIYLNIFKEKRLDIVGRPDTYISEGKIENAVEKFMTNPYATIVTNKGTVEMELYFDVAPLTVMNFIELAETDFYDGLNFHRIVPNFVVQGGDPRGDGWGGPDYYIRCEYSQEKYIRGTVGIATSGKDTGGSQFFFTLSPQPHLEGRYTIFGQVLSGMDVIDEIVPGDIIEDVIIEENQIN